METKNYSVFKIKENNRVLSQGLIKRIEDSILEFGYINSRPVLVDKFYNIIDGQHRFFACQNLQIPIVYEIAPDNIDSDDLMIKLNSVQDVWRLADYVHHYATKGIGYYCELSRFEEDHKMGISNTLILVTEKFRPNPNKIRKGYAYEISDKRFSVLDFIKKNKTLPFFKTKKFVGAVKTLFDKADKRQIQKVQNKIISLPEQASERHYLNAFENMINRANGSNNISL